MSNRQINSETTDCIDELHYEPVSPKFRSVQYITATITYAVSAALALLLLLADTPRWCIAVESVIIVSFIVNLIILRNAYRFKGYALREHDITYRSGVIFPITTTVSFSKIQQISVSQNPVPKSFGLCAINIVNGAQGLSSLTINGLTREKAEGIKNVITRRINNAHD